MTIQIPNLKKILKPTWAHNVGYKVNSSGWHKMKVLKQATNPKDKKILEKLGMKKGDKVLAIAGYYGNWASGLNKAGAKVTYSDISRPMVNYVKKTVKPKFENYICSNYELIPKHAGEFDWTFTFEACGGSQGLPIAYLRSLINNKGGIMVLFWNTIKPQSMGGKPKSYPRIINTLADTYGAKAEMRDIKFMVNRDAKSYLNLPHKVYIIRTNDSARKKAEFDLNFLTNLRNKRKIHPENKEETASLKRLNRFADALGKDFVRVLEVK